MSVYVNGGDGDVVDGWLLLSMLSLSLLPLLIKSSQSASCLLILAIVLPTNISSS